MSTLNVDLINGPRHQSSGEGSQYATDADADLAQTQAFQEHLGVEEQTLKAKTHEIDPEQLKKINEDFLHSAVALNALHESYKSASKQQSAAHKGEEAWIGSGDQLSHANKKITLGAQEHVLVGSPTGVEV